MAEKKSEKSEKPAEKSEKTRKVQAIGHARSSLHIGKIYEVPEAKARQMVKEKLAKYVND